jgi:ATP-dependent protease HslVU (ClpYQ) peptidase subunit
MHRPRPTGRKDPTVATENEQQIRAYESGAAQSLAAQRALEASGQSEAAKAAQAAVNANLDAIANLKKPR